MKTTFPLKCSGSFSSASRSATEMSSHMALGPPEKGTYQNPCPSTGGRSTGSRPWKDRYFSAAARAMEGISRPSGRVMDSR